MNIEELLLVLKIAFLVLLYLFIWRIVSTASRDLRLPQESFILRPGEAEGLGREASSPVTGQLVVLQSPALEEGETFDVDSAPISAGRLDDNVIVLGNDEFASSHHARFEPRRDGVWLEDVGSTNGTYLNGIRISRPRKLSAGDVVRIGETDLKFEPSS